MLNKLFILALLLPIGLFGQNRSLDLTMKFKDLKGQNLVNIEVLLIETSTKQEVKLTTDANGVVQTVLDTGFRWSINFLDIKEYGFVELPSSGVRTQSRTITYIPAKYREETSNFDRTGITFTEQKQFANGNTAANKTHNLLAVKVVDKSKKGQQGIKLALVNLELKTKYTSSTNPAGWAYFLLPVGRKYEIDVPGIEAYKKMDIPAEGFTSLEIEILFVPTKVDEVAANDTIVQNLNASTQATSERVLMKVLVRNFEGQGLENELVFWDDKESDEVYLATTDRTGHAYFLLPKNKIFTLNLTYEREIELFNLENKNAAIASGYIEVSYRGTLVIEEFYKTTARNADGIVTQFMSTPITPQQVTKEYFEESADGFLLNFETNSMLYTPLVINGKIYTSHGFYSNEFSCFDANTGQMLWSTQLGEGGASPAAYYDGYILLITESCSFYLLNAETGALAWSKWLAPYVLSSPSATNGKIYVVYENDATDFNNRQNAFVMACFDLKTGNVVWQKWVDGEGLSSPILYENGVYLTTHAGTLYHFEESTGEILHQISMDFTSAPTITENYLYINKRDKTHGQTLCQIAHKDWSLQSLGTNGQFLPGAFDRMADMEALIPYEGSRCLILADKMFYTLDNLIFCRDLQGKLLWQKGLFSAPTEPQYGLATMPIVVGKNVMVGTFDGRLLTFDAKTGALLETIKVGSPVVHQPALANSNIYVPTNGAIKVIKTKDKAKDGWPMWNNNSEHNTYFE